MLLELAAPAHAAHATADTVSTRMQPGSGHVRNQRRVQHRTAAQLHELNPLRAIVFKQRDKVWLREDMSVLPYAQPCPQRGTAAARFHNTHLRCCFCRVNAARSAPVVYILRGAGARAPAAMSYPQGSGRGPFGSINSGQAINVTTKMHQGIAQFVGTTFQSKETASLPTCLREDLLLTCDVPGAQASSVQHVTSIDLLEFDNAKKQTVRFDGTNSFNLHMPTDYAQYACDVHDARTSIELVMAANQMCILTGNSADNVRTYAPDPRVYHSKASHSVFMKPDDENGTKSLVIRRCVLYDSSEYPELDEMARNIQELATNEGDFKGLVQVYDLNQTRDPDETGIKGVNELRNILLGKEKASKPKCTHKGGTLQTFTPPKFSYAGIAMTDAYINSVHGDTHVTCNLFSSITLTNGPVAVAHGDTMHWIWRVEMHYYTKDGSRLPRSSWVTTPVENLLSDIYTNSSSNTLYGQPRANQRDSKMLQRVCANLYMVPLKEGFANQLLSAGMLDRKNQRKVGHAISSAPAFGSLDLMHYGKGTNT